MSDSLLPPNASPLELAVESSMAGRSLPLRHRDLWSADKCPSNLLPWLAWALSVKTWDATWSDSKKRSVIKSSITTARVKGTRASMETALAAFGIQSSSIVEWFQTGGGGAAHTFKILNVANDLNTRIAIESEVNRVKPLRSTYTIDSSAIAATANIYTAASFQPYIWQRLDCAAN